MPFQQNINWTQLVGVVCALLAAFGFNVPDDVRVEMVTVITAATAIVTWILHTFVNHPANVDHVRALTKSIYDRAKTGAPYVAPVLLATIIVPLFLLSGCASLGGGPSSQEMQGANTALIVVNGAEQFIVDVCVQPAAGIAPKACTNNKNVIKATSARVDLGVTNLMALLGAQSGDPVAIDAALAALALDIAALQGQANAAKTSVFIDPNLVIQLVGIAIQVGMNVYAQWQASQTQTPTLAQLQALQSAEQAYNAKIQAW